MFKSDKSLDSTVSASDVECDHESVPDLGEDFFWKVGLRHERDCGVRFDIILLLRVKAIEKPIGVGFLRGRDVPLWGRGCAEWGGLVKCACSWDRGRSGRNTWRGSSADRPS